MNRIERNVLFLFVISLSIVLTGCESRKKARDEHPITIVIHGGAGTISKSGMKAKEEKEYREKLEEALERGHGILKKGGSSLDAVEAAIKVMEDSPLFNAGKGAVFTNEGRNELDASIMDGKTLKAGAVAAVTTIKNPIVAARAVMEHTKHVMLVGKGAETFAKEQKLDIVSPKYFFTKKRWEQLERARTSDQSFLESSEKEPFVFGTVGAVALDRNGNLAAGTSTGGLTNKLYGRVGDSPIVGAGTYANNNTCAVSGTGQGEYFIRNVIAYDTSAMIEYAGMTLEQAANKVIHEKLTTLGGSGGIIALDKNGNIAMPFNTEGMYRGYVKADGKKQIYLYGGGAQKQ